MTPQPPLRKFYEKMHLVSEVQTSLLLGILRPKGVIAYPDIELLVAWILEQYSNRLRKFVVNLSQVSVEPEVALLIVRMADLSVEYRSPICFILPPNLDPAQFTSSGISQRIAFFADEDSAVSALR